MKLEIRQGLQNINSHKQNNRSFSNKNVFVFKSVAGIAQIEIAV